MITQGTECPKTARQLTAVESPLLRGKCVQLSNQSWVEDFLSLYDTDKSVNRDDAIIRKLGELHDRQTSLELKFLLDRVDKKVLLEYAYTFMAQEALAQCCTVKVIVSKLPENEKPKGNIGKFVISTQKEGGESMMLRFTNKASTIYYLMCLLERCQNSSPKAFSLANNRQVFINLYSFVYDNLSYSKISTVYDNLRFRKVDGNMRNGRLGATIADIRKHLSQRFDVYGESYKPYALTSSTHLSVPSNMIVFKDEAAALLKQTIA